MDDGQRTPVRSSRARRPGTTGVKPCCTASREAAARRADESSQVAPAVDPPGHDMVSLDGGEFAMGSDAGEGYKGDGEGPSRRVRCSPFTIATRTVSNAEFTRFVDETGYATDAERYGWSFVFHLFVGDAAAAARVPDIPWWVRVDGACWRHPEGPGSDLSTRMDHPVVHVSWFDAAAYCRWSGTRLPTEAEWEYAARGGLDGARYAWGDELTPGGRHRCNVWQGRFPDHDTGEDGFTGTAPVDAFEANGFGLYNVCGNVWEWCADTFSPNYHRVTRMSDPIYLVPTGKRSMRGGSYLCHNSYCNRYRVAARSANTPDSTTGHCSFRVVRR